MERLERLLELGGTKRGVVFLVVSGAALAVSIFNLSLLPFDAAWVAIILCGTPIVLEAVIGLVTRFDIKADVLVAMALIASVAIGEDFAAGEVAFIMQLGALLEDLTVAKARAGIEKLARLTPLTARLLKDGAESVVPAEDVKVGDVLRVLPGESVPVDGVILSGQTSVNQAVMTGESMPVDKTAGDSVSSGTVNQFGAFEMRAEKVGEDSSIQRMIRLVQSADASKAKIVTLADRWATWVVVAAIAAAVLAYVATGEIIRSVTVLVVFCPCALVLATPTAVVAAIGNASKHGFLVREGDALERLSCVGKIAFDKTGTLTYGTPKVVAVESCGSLSGDEIFAFAAAAERFSEHPLGKAVVKSYGKTPLAAEDFVMTPGAGVSATVDGRRVCVGNLKLVCGGGAQNAPREATDAVDKYARQGRTAAYVSIDGVISGIIALSDAPRREGRKMVRDLNGLGVTSALLSGDADNSVGFTAGQLGIKGFRANCLPEDKMEYIDAARKNNISVCMVGDGVNDAPALKKRSSA